MRKSQIFLLLGAVALFATLSVLPRNVVDNEGGEMTSSEATKEGDESEEAHEPLSGEMQRQFTALKSKYETASSENDKSIMLDSLIDFLVANNRIDSAAVYAESFASSYPSWETRKKAADLYFDAFTFALSAEKTKRLGEKATEMYAELLNEKPDSIDLAVKMGVVKVSSGKPMDGILAIRQIFEDHPENQLAIYYLGTFAIRSNQFDKAIERFTELKRLNPESLEAEFYLGVSYFQLGDTERAMQIFQSIKARTNDPNIIASVNSYLQGRERSTESDLDSDAGKQLREPLSKEKQAQLEALKYKLELGISEGEKKTALDKLVDFLVANNRVDSAAIYAESFSSSYPSWEARKNTADLYFRAFNEEPDVAIGEKITKMYSELLSEKPELTDLSVKMGVVKVSSGKPMDGILAIRKISEEHPDNQLAVYYLGFFAVRSKQYEKAIERFTQLREMGGENIEADYYLAYSYYQIGDREKSHDLLHAVKDKVNDPVMMEKVNALLQKVEQ